MAQIREIQQALHALSSIAARLELYMVAAELGSMEKRRLRDWMHRLAEIRHQADMHQLGVMEYSMEDEEKLMSNSQELINALERIYSELEGQAKPEVVLGLLDSICPLWPFC